MRPRPGSGPAIARAVAIPCLVAAAVAACATARPRPIRKLIDGEIVVVRPIDPNAYEHAARAFLYESEERYADAAAELQRALNYDADSVELRARLAEVFLRLGRLEDAAEQIQASLRVEESVAAHVAAAHLAQQRGDAAAGVAATERAIALAVAEGDLEEIELAHLELARAKLLAFDHGGARATLRALVDALPRATAPRVFLAGVAWAMGDVKGARSVLEDALAGAPGDLDAQLTLAWLDAATGHPQARASFRRAIETAEGDPQVVAAAARFLVGVGDAKEALRLVEEHVGDPGIDAATVAAQIDLARSGRDFARARALGADFLAKDAESPGPVLVALGQALFDEKKLDEAVAAWRRVSSDADEFLPARARVADALARAGDLSGAERALADVVVEAASDGAALLAQARAALDEKRGDAARAVRRLEDALAERPDDLELTLALAAAEDRRGNWRHALGLAERIIKRAPDDVAALNFWGFVAAERGFELPLADRRLVTALALDRGNAAIIDSVGWVAFKRGELDRAESFLRQAARLVPDDAEILAHLAALAERRGDVAGAAATLRRALAADPDDDLRRRLQADLARLGARDAAGR